MDKKAECKRMREQNTNDAGIMTGSIEAAACRFRLLHYNSEQFKLLGRLFSASQPQHLRLVTGAERIASHRLVKAGLIKASKGKKVHRCCGYVHSRYSITLAGKAHFVASELGVSFPQLCYLACARSAARNSIIGGMPSFAAADVDSVFSVVLEDISPKVTRKVLTRKGFLVKRVWHASAVTARFAELERYAAVMDELYLWMKMEYEIRTLQAMRDPAIAKMVDLVRQNME